MGLWNVSAILDPVASPSCLGPAPKQHAWQNASSPDPYHPGKIVNANTWFMGIDLVFHPWKNQTTKLCVACVYKP